MPTPEQRLATRGLTLGAAVGIIRRKARAYHEAHEDVDMWYAPSECHYDVDRSFVREPRRIRRQVGCSIEDVLHMVTKRTNAKVAHHLVEDPFPGIDDIVRHNRMLSGRRSHEDW